MLQSIRDKKHEILIQMERLETKLCVVGVLVTEQRQAIVETRPTELLRQLKEGDLTAVEVLHAFQSKALEVTRRLNCITEFIPEAEKWAMKCDSLPVEDRGSLHGLPLSIKENVNVQGMDTTMGLAKFLNQPVSSHAVVVETLIQKGAVPFCKTNVPQVLMSFCCSNPVYGETFNPHDLTRTPGGSSGGEGALIGAGGSVLGIGTDLGGSVRVPASFSGCVAIKPTQNRLSTKGIKKGLEGQTGVMGTVGIMGRDVDIVAACMKALMEDDTGYNLDPTTVPLPWNDLKFKSTRKLVFGYFDSCSIFPASPGVLRAVKESRLALERAGHEVKPFDIPDFYDLIIDMMNLLSADGGECVANYIENEIVDPSLEKGFKVVTAYNFLKPLIKLKVMFHSQLAADFIQYDCLKSNKLWQYLARRSNKINEIIENMKELNVDLILSPSYPIPAPQSFVPSTIMAAVLYTSVFNYFNFPSGCVPVTKESEMDQMILEGYPEKELLHRIAKEATRGAMDLPIGVLISGLPWSEELVARGMMELQEALKTSGQQTELEVTDSCG